MLILLREFFLKFSSYCFYILGSFMLCFHSSNWNVIIKAVKLTEEMNLRKNSLNNINKQILQTLSFSGLSAYYLENIDFWNNIMETISCSERQMNVQSQNKHYTSKEIELKWSLVNRTKYESSIKLKYTTSNV